MKAKAPPVTEVLTNAELVAARKELGVSGPWLADYLDSNDRTLRRWEAGITPVPGYVCEAVAELLAEARGHVAQAVQAVLADESVTYLKMPRNADQLEEMPGAPEWGYPASWHQQIITRAAAEVQRVSGRRLRLCFFDEAPDAGDLT